MAVCSLGEREFEILWVVLAAEGIYVANMVDIDAMGVPDPEGHSRHAGDWESGDGKAHNRAESYCPIWVHEDWASFRNIVHCD
jgi:hypothetical protein